MMQKIVFLLMILFCMTACQDEMVQEVSFDNEMITVGAEAQTVTVEVTANCPWYIKTESQRAYASSTYGEGSSYVDIVIFKNGEYEYAEHVFTLTSEDGTGHATLTIKQDPRIKMEITSDGVIPAEGGYFNIYMSTNDEVSCTDYPEWVTHVISISIKDKNFVLECKDNRTGSPRYATVVFTGREEEYAVNIKQDSYTPTGISLNIPESLVDGLGEYCYKMDVVPVYADWNKLDITLTKEDISGSKSEVWTKGEYIHFRFEKYGTYTLTIYANETLVLKQNMTVHPVDAVLTVADGEDVCVGDIIMLSDENCSLEFSNKSLVQKQSDGSYRFINEGDLTVTATNHFSGKKKTATIKVSNVVLNIETTRVTAAGDKNKVYVLYSARGCDMTGYQFYLTETKYPAQQLEVMEDTVSNNKMQTVYYSPSEEWVDASEEYPLRYVLDKYTLHFETTIKGVKHHIKKNFNE